MYDVATYSLFPGILMDCKVFFFMSQDLVLFGVGVGYPAASLALSLFNIFFFLVI